VLSQITDILVGRPSGFAVLSGDDEMTLPVCMLGGDGLISVVSNAAPRLMAELVRKARGGDVSGARELHLRALPLMRAATVESNPIPIKAALAMLGHCAPGLRSPLVQLDARHEAVVRLALQHAGAL
jgi:4-hydroxy-tetrahydrodipicolinate synthase